MKTLSFKLKLFSIFFIASFIAAGSLALSGCGGGGGGGGTPSSSQNVSGGGTSSSPSSSQTYNVAPATASPIIGATASLYEQGITTPFDCVQGSGSTAGTYSCTVSPAPASGTPLMFTLTGGNIGSAAGSPMPAKIVFSTVFNSSTTGSTIPVNELTTAMTDATLSNQNLINTSNGSMPYSMGALTSAQAATVLNMVALMEEYIDVYTAGATAGNLSSTAPAAVSNLAPYIETMANAMANCINSGSSSSTTTTQCSDLFADAGISSTASMTDITAVMMSNLLTGASGVNLSGMNSLAMMSNPEFTTSSGSTPTINTTTTNGTATTGMGSAMSAFTKTASTTSSIGTTPMGRM